MFLKSTDDLILEIVPESEIDDVRLLDILLNHATILKEEINWGMFVPCDTDGNILEAFDKPIYENYWSDNDTVFSAEEYRNHVNRFRKYRNAEKRVLFKGFKTNIATDRFLCLDHISGNKLTLYKECGSIITLLHRPFEIEWSETALIKIGLKVPSDEN